jgi:hypothetical protein
MLHQRENADADPEQTGHYEAYATFSKTLRTWLVAYGIGVPALIFSNEKITEAVGQSGRARLIVICFLGGVCVQVFGTLLYKTTEWYLYSGEAEKAFKGTRRYAFGVWINDQYWLELAIDIAAIALFAVATYKTLVSIAWESFSRSLV